jgi:hypothetical protein
MRNGEGTTRLGPPQAAALRHRATSLWRMISCFAEGKRRYWEGVADRVLLRRRSRALLFAAA